MRWRIHYDNDSIFTSEDGHPRDAPARGVVAITQWRSGGIHKNMYVSRCAFFVWDEVDQQWYDCDYIGMVDRLLLRQDKALIKLGRYVPDDQWELIKREAQTSDGRH